MSDMNVQQKKWSKVVAKAWADENYKQRLVADPAAVLAEEDIEVPAGHALRIVEVGQEETLFVIPPRPSAAEISEVDVEQMAAAMYSIWL